MNNFDTAIDTRYFSNSDNAGPGVCQAADTAGFGGIESSVRL